MTDGPDRHRVCAVIPTFDNPATIGAVVEGVRRHIDVVIVVDDGSGERARDAIDALAQAGLVRLVRRPHRGGKGAAVKDGLREALARGFTHALQIDADGQHDADAIPRFLEASLNAPAALVAGAPVFDPSAPRGRLLGRKVSIFWAMVELGRRAIADPLCGYRVYPVAAALAAGARGDAMDFDPEIAVRMARAGAPIVNVPTHVRYVPRAEGGVSHFRMVRDNLLISRMNAGLCVEGLLGLLSPRRWGARPS